MGISFDYDFGTNEVLVDDAPKDSTVIVNGTKYVPEFTRDTCEGCVHQNKNDYSMYCHDCTHLNYNDFYESKVVK